MNRVHAPALLPPPPLARHGERWALFLDVDGTLLDFALRPELVRAGWPLLEHLRVVNARLDGALALVSGRAVGDLEKLFAPLRLNLVGLHGLERHLLGADYQRSWHADPARLESLYADAERIAAQLPGVRVERKGPCVALHCREAPLRMPELAEAAQALAARIPDYTLLRGYEVCEIKPAQADKGVAVAELMRQAPFAGRRPVYLGDDHTDEPALRAVRELDGMAVTVGARMSTSATHALPYPHAVRLWLGELARDPSRQGAS